LSKSKIFLFSSLFFIIGITIASFCPDGFFRQEIWFFAGAVLSAAGVFIFFRRRIRVVFFCLFGLMIGCWRYGLTMNYGLTGLESKIGRKTVLTGYVSNDPIEKEKSRNFEFKAEKADGREVSGRIMIYAALYPRYRYGGYLEINCDLKRPGSFGGFAYDRYLAKEGIGFVCFYPEIKKTGEGGNEFFRLLFKTRDRFSEIFASALPEREAELAKAIFLGKGKELSDDSREVFSRSGLAHLAAVSGLHVGLVSAAIFTSLLSVGIGRRRAFYLAIVFVWLYVLFSGAAASAIRAGIMGLLALLAAHCGRLNKLVNLIVFAAAVMLFVNPMLLRDDAGFQLSFAAMGGIAIFYPLFARFRKKEFSRPVKLVFDLTALSLAAQIFVVPFAASKFGIISLVALPANLAVIWALPLIFFTLFFGLGLALILPAFAGLFLAPAFIVLKFVAVAADFFAGLPFSSLDYDFSGFWPTTGYGAAVIVLYFVLFRLAERKAKPEIDIITFDFSSEKW